MQNPVPEIPESKILDPAGAWLWTIFSRSFDFSPKVFLGPLHAHLGHQVQIQPGQKDSRFPGVHFTLMEQESWGAVDNV